MTGLFIELYLDEDVSVLVADLLRARGFAAITTRETGQLGNSDADQMAFAVSQHKAVLTHNRVHFERYRRSTSQRGSYTTASSLRSVAPAHEIVRRLLVLLNHVTADEMRNQIRYI